MTTIAIAGGTGHVGRTIASVLKKNPKYNVITLSRKAPETEDPEAPNFIIDYNDVTAVTKLLESNNVQTVISAIFVVLPAAGESEINLVKAATQSSSTTRFISSDWGLPHPKDDPQPFREATLQALRKTDLEFTTFHIGYFADYFGLPYIESYLQPSVGNIDIKHLKAAIPGDGNDIQAFTYSFDLARFVEAALGLPKSEWQEATNCWSEKTTFNQVIKLAEEARGAKFTVIYDSVEKLEAGQVTELPGHLASYEFYPKPLLQKVFASFGLYITRGLVDLPEENSLNQKFPEIKTKSIKEIVDAWKGK